MGHLIFGIGLGTRPSTSTFAMAKPNCQISYNSIIIFLSLILVTVYYI